MKQGRKFIIKFYLVSFALGLACVLVSHFTHDDELILISRLIGLAFFFGVYLWVRKVVDKTNKMVKESHGFLQQPFDPKILLLTQELFLGGWTSFSILDYFHMNFVEWIFLYTMAIIIIPISQGLLKLIVRDNKWR